MKKLNLLVMGLVITSMTIPLTSLSCAGDDSGYYVDLKVNEIYYVLNWNNWREVIYNIKNVGNWQANPTFYCDVFFEVRYIDGERESISRTLLARQPFITILYPGQVSLDHYKSKHWENSDPDHYSARFVVHADSTDLFNEELSENDNWAYTNWFI